MDMRTEAQQVDVGAVARSLVAAIETTDKAMHKAVDDALRADLRAHRKQLVDALCGMGGAVSPREDKTNEDAMRRLADAARALLFVTGEIDDDDDFSPCPHPSLSESVRDEIAPWIEDQWRALRAMVGGQEGQS
jgi:hypothetical protein